MKRLQNKVKATKKVAKKVAKKATKKVAKKPVKKVAKKEVAISTANPTKSVKPKSQTTSVKSTKTSAIGKKVKSHSTQVSLTAPAANLPEKKSLVNCIQTKATQPKREPTLEQKEIIQAAIEVLARGGVLVVEAGAGTGKTTTLRMLADALEGQGQYTAFNSSLVAESKSKFQGTRVACNTTHSLGFRAEGKSYSHRLNGSRVRSEQIARMLGIDDFSIPFGEGTKPLSASWLASQVIGAIRRFCQSADPQVDVSHFRYIDGIDLPEEDGHRTYENNTKVREYLLPFAEKAWTDIANPEGQLPFSHDYYVKIWQLNHPVITGDYILLDESQDTAAVMLDILAQQLNAKHHPALILVGDSAQQIYEWRGAINAMASFPDAPRKFLSQSFRFGEAIAKIANQVLGCLKQATPLQLKGLSSIPSELKRLDDPQAILCRTNASAVSSLLGAIAAGKKPFLVGGGSDVIAFVEGAQRLQQGLTTNHADLACFLSWKEVQEYSKMDEGEDLRLMVRIIDGFGAETILSALKSMPEERYADLIISTAHKSKGREWDSVRLASDFPTKSKSTDADLKLLYVAVTRAKLALDTSECPFFTGEDALDISELLVSQKDTPSIIPPAPSTPTTPQEFTWAKSKAEGKWVIRGPAGFAEKEVDVVRKNGSTSRQSLGIAVWEDGSVALYQVR